MDIIGTIKTKLDELMSPTTNEDYPHARLPRLYQTLTTLLGLLPGIATGTFTGDTDDDITVGYADTNDVEDTEVTFDPKLVIVWNPTTQALGFHIAGMTAAHMGLIVADAASPPAHADISAVTSSGITLGSRQFTIGQNANLNSDGVTGHYFAIGV